MSLHISLQLQRLKCSPICTNQHYNQLTGNLWKWDQANKRNMFMSAWHTYLHLTRKIPKFYEDIV